MNSKEKKYKWIFTGMVIFILIFISIMTLYYPYSTFSLYKSYTYQPTKPFYGEKNYLEMLNDFKTTYEKELAIEEKKIDPNLTIIQTQYILPRLEQDWLISEDPATFNKKKLEVLLNDLTYIEVELFPLLIQADQAGYDSEDREDLIFLIREVLSLEDSIKELRDVNFESKRSIDFRFNIIEESYASLLDEYVSFYERVTTE